MSKHKGLGEFGNFIMLILLGLIILIGSSMYYQSILANQSIAYDDVNEKIGTTEAYNKIQNTSGAMAAALSTSKQTDSNAFYIIMDGAFRAVPLLFSFLDITVSLFGGVFYFFETIGGVYLAWVIVLAFAAISTYITLRILEIAIGRNI